MLYLHRVHRTAVAVNAHDTITFFLKIKIPHCSTSCIAASSGSFASFYTPEYAANAPSIGIHAPLTNPLASSHARNRTEPISSSTSPKRSIGVLFKILPVLAVGVPSSLNRSFAFCCVEKIPVRSRCSGYPPWKNALQAIR